MVAQIIIWKGKRQVTVNPYGDKRTWQVPTKYGWVGSSVKTNKDYTTQKGYQIRIGQWDKRIQAMPSKDKFFIDKNKAIKFLNKQLK